MLALWKRYPAYHSNMWGLLNVLFQQNYITIRLANAPQGAFCMALFLRNMIRKDSITDYRTV